MENVTGDPQLDIVAQRWPDITLAEAADVLSRLRHPLRALELLTRSGRPTAAGAMIRTNEGDVFIKRYALSVRDAASILPYHGFVHYLAKRGISTPTFMPFADDLGGSAPGGPIWATDSALTIGGAVYEVCAKAEGDDRYIDALSWDPPRTVSEAEQLGAFMARMSMAAEGYDAPRPAAPNPFQNRFGLFAAEDFDVAVKAWLEERPVVRDYLKSTDRHLMQDLDLHRRYVEKVSGPYGALPSCWTHGDPHISNFLWQGDRPSSIFDFGLADRNTALFDLVETLERNTIRFVSIMNGEDDAYCADTAAAIIRGYNGVIPLSSSDLALVADMLPVCQSEAALNWIAYYVEGTHRPQDAAWCYDISLMGHTAWFARPSGQRYLDAIRMAA